MLPWNPNLNKLPHLQAELYCNRVYWRGNNGAKNKLRRCGQSVVHPDQPLTVCHSQYGQSFALVQCSMLLVASGTGVPNNPKLPITSQPVLATPGRHCFISSAASSYHWEALINLVLMLMQPSSLRPWASSKISAPLASSCYKSQPDRVCTPDISAL